MTKFNVEFAVNNGIDAVAEFSGTVEANHLDDVFEDVRKLLHAHYNLTPGASADPPQAPVQAFEAPTIDGAVVVDAPEAEDDEESQDDSEE